MQKADFTQATTPISQVTQWSIPGMPSFSALVETPAERVARVLEALTLHFDDITPDRIERALLDLPQAACSLVHRFGPGIYIRELHMAADTLAVGHHQNFEHVNVMLKGRVLMINEDGSTKELVAPLFFIGQPGRKMGYVLEDMVWQNIYAADSQDIDALEAKLISKSGTWIDRRAVKHRLARVAHQVDRDDYLALLDEFGILHEDALVQSRNTDDQVGWPYEMLTMRLAESPIDGRGMFCTYPVEAGDILAPARIAGKRTPAGRYVNHSMNPNAEMALLPNGDVNLVATRAIDGCHGGDDGEEITICYRQALGLHGLLPKE